MRGKTIHKEHPSSGAECHVRPSGKYTDAWNKVTCKACLSYRPKRGPRKPKAFDFSIRGDARRLYPQDLSDRDLGRLREWLARTISWRKWK